MVPNPDPKQYSNNWKNDMLLFSAANQERPYEQLPHNCFVVPPKFCTSIVFNFSWDLKSPKEKFKTMLMQILEGNKKYYGIFEKGLLVRTI